MHRAMFLVLLLWPFAALAAEDFDSANHLLPKCKMVLNSQTDTEAGVCLGIMLTMKATSRLYEGNIKSCVPENATLAQMIRVLVKYVEDRPSQMQLPLISFTLVALHDAWPCGAK